MSFAHLEVAPSFCLDPSGPFLVFPYRHTRFRSIHTHTLNYSVKTHRRPQAHITTLYRNGASLPLSSRIVLYHWSIIFFSSCFFFFFQPCPSLIPHCWLSRVVSSCTSATQALSLNRVGSRKGWAVTEYCTSFVFTK